MDEEAADAIVEALEDTLVLECEGDEDKIVKLRQHVIQKMLRIQRAAGEQRQAHRS